MNPVYSVELRQVIKRFDDVTAVDHVDLQIREGEFFSLLGPSGCGKTTTLRLIAGFELPTAGEVYIGGQAQGYLPAHQRPVNTVFQHYALFPHMSVAQNVGFGLEMRGVSKIEIRRRVEEMLDLVRLPGLGARRPRQLSGGQQQRVALARALVNRPRVLLLDEPLAALDQKLRAAMQIELKALQSQVGITFIYVTHDQEEALTMSDRIGVMNEGRLLQVGSPQEVYEAPRSRFVSDFIGETNYLDGQVVRLRGREVEISAGPDLRIRAQAGGHLHLDQPVTVGFRPEKVVLNGHAHPGWNAARGRVQEVVYTGAATTYHVLISGAQTVRVRQLNYTALPDTRFQTGDQVMLSWPAEACKAFVEAQ